MCKASSLHDFQKLRGAVNAAPVCMNCGTQWATVTWCTPMGMTTYNPQNRDPSGHGVGGSVT